MSFYLAIGTAIELMCERCESMGKVVNDLLARVSELEKQIEKLKLPDYLPDEVKVSDWQRVRELDHKERELEIEMRRVGSFALPESPPSVTFEDRVKEAKAKGFVWPTRKGVEPSRQSTKEKMLGEWESQYVQGESLSDEEIKDVGKVTQIGAGAIQIAVNRLMEMVEDQVDVEGLNLYNTYQKLVKSLKDLPTTITTPGIDYKPTAELLKRRIFNGSLDPENDLRVTELFVNRLERFGGVKGLTPDLIKQCCNLERLPTFFEWEPNHISPDSRLFSLKSGQYDSHFESLIGSFSVESQ